ncbi:MAG: hypothetical protein L3K06_00075 [Thermoplasmata archaeon]|nr:hypothetical protein [Thermoplasmata archaeon]
MAPTMSMSPPPAPPTDRRPSTWLVAGVAVVMLLIGLGGGYVLFRGNSGGSSSMPSGTVSGLPVPTSIDTVQGWYQNASFTYLDFGENTNVSAPIVVLTSNGVAVPGQHNIIDTLPGQPGYSAFWRVYTVAVPAGYVADSVRSFGAVRASGWTLTETSTVVNCPVVNPGTTIQGQSGPLTQGWYENETVFYWGGEGNSTTYGDVVATAPLYALQYANGTAVAGQRHIVNVLPGDPGYSDLWQITSVVVAANYVPNTYMSVGSLWEAESLGEVTITPTSTMVNCPVV